MSSGKVFEEEEKAAENIYIKVRTSFLSISMSVVNYESVVCAGHLALAAFMLALRLQAGRQPEIVSTSRSCPYSFMSSK